MKTYKYKVFDKSDGSAIKKLIPNKYDPSTEDIINHFAKDGWRFVQVHRNKLYFEKEA